MRFTRSDLWVAFVSLVTAIVVNLILHGPEILKGVCGK